MRTSGSFLLGAVACVTFSVCVTAQVENKSIRPLNAAHKVALVIGNSNYAYVPKIPPAVNDAADMAGALRKLGFDVDLKTDLGGEALVEAVVRFSRGKVQSGDVAFVYYSGHGGQVAGENFLLPIDYQPPSEDELVERRAYKMSLVRDALERTGASVRVLIFDACRDSPVTSSKGVASGLHGISGKAEGTLIAFASADNQVARYETGQRNSFYTAELLTALNQSPGDLKTLLEQVQQRVFLKTQRQQTPYLYGFLSAPLFLGAAPPLPIPPADDLERQAWEQAKGNRAMVEAFLREFPDSQYARLARIALAGTAPIPPEGPPKSAAEKREIADKLLSSNQVDEALKLYSELASLNPRDVQVEWRLAQVYRLKHDLAHARSVLEYAFKLDNANLDVWYEEVNLLADERKMDEALRRLQTMLAKTAKSSYTETERAYRLMLLQRQAQLHDSARHFTEMGTTLAAAEALAGTVAEKNAVYFMRGRMYERTKKYDAAEAEFRKILVTEPDNAAALNYLAYILADTGVKIEEGAKMASRALQIEPRNGAFLDTMGWVYFRQNRLNDAEKLMVQALAGVGQDPAIRDHLGDVYFKQGKTKDAIVQWQTAIKEYEAGVSPDMEAAEAAKIARKLESAKIRLATEGRR